MTSSADSIYQNKQDVEDFTFNQTVSRVFDDMVSRSIPHYYDAQQLIVDFIKDNITDNTAVYDLGCATGTSLLLLEQTVGDAKNLRYIGIDNSTAMLEKAQEKISSLVDDTDKFQFVLADIAEYDNYDSAGCMILNLTLQFIRPIKRVGLMKRLYDNLQPGGILVLFEKLVDSQSKFNRQYIEMYYHFKRRNQYSDIEISKKREELENVLIPFTEQENYDMLREAGFTSISTIFKYLNFGVILAVK